jgi:hypothetical protein
MKDLVEHIRTVHFTLVVTCMVLLLATLHEARRPLMRAYEQALAIQRLDMNAVNKEVLRVAQRMRGSDAFTSHPFGTFTVRVGNGHKLMFTAPRWFLLTNGQSSYNFWTTSVDERIDFRSDKLTDFRSLWDARFNFVVFEGPLPIAPPCVSPPLPADRSEVKKPDVHGSLLRFWTDGEVLRGEIVANEDMPFMCSIVPTVGVRGLAVDVKDILHTQLSSRTSLVFGKGDSQTEFSELIDASRGLGSLAIRDLVLYLNEQANKETERIELFQTRIPVSVIGWIGALAIVLSQFYLWAHLRQLDLRVVGDVRVEQLELAYVGLYSGQIIGAFVFATLTILPFIPLLRLGLLESLPGWASAVSLGVSSSLGLWSIWLLRRVRKKISASMGVRCS